MAKRMVHNMESRMLRMRFTIVFVCLDKLIHQLGKYVWHLMLITSKQNVSQLISQRANTKISRRQSRPDLRTKESGFL